MEKTSKNNEAAQLGIGAVINSAYRRNKKKCKNYFINPIQSNLTAWCMLRKEKYCEGVCCLYE